MTLAEQLKDIHRRAMLVKPPAVDLFTILLYELMPLIESRKELADVYKIKSRIEGNSFQNIRGCLEDEAYRAITLNNSDSVWLGAFQQDVTKVCMELISIAKNIPEKAGATGKIRKGRPSSIKYKENRIYLDGKHIKIKRNQQIQRMIEKMFGGSVRVGEKIGCDELYRHVYDVHDDMLDAGWHKLYSIISRFNETVRKQTSIEFILEFDGTDAKKIKR